MPASGPETRGLGLAGPPLSPPRSASSWPSVPGDGPGGGALQGGELVRAEHGVTGRGTGSD